MRGERVNDHDTKRIGFAAKLVKNVFGRQAMVYNHEPIADRVCVDMEKITRRHEPHPNVVGVFERDVHDATSLNVAAKQSSAFAGRYGERKDDVERRLAGAGLSRECVDRAGSQHAVKRIGKAFVLREKGGHGF